jgi:NAD+ synthase
MSLNGNQQKVASFDRSALVLDAAAEVERIVVWLRDAVHHQLHRQGAVVGISGGVDSSVVLALCARAFGPDRVAALMLPERDSSPDSAALAGRVAARYGVIPVLEEISGALDGFGCYQRRDEAVRRIFPQFEPDWKTKITLPGNLLDKDTLNIFHLTVMSPDGREWSKRMPLREYYQIVAASNFKQRTRMALLYYHAELRNYAVIGTANRAEHDQGFFVKHGDGGVDVQPIVHLFKTQVYQLAEALDVPAEVRRRPPTSDTYSAGSTQEEFFFRVPFEILDTVWLGYEQGVPSDEIGRALGLSAEQVERVIADIVRKQRTTAYLRVPALGLDTRQRSSVELAQIESP